MSEHDNGKKRHVLILANETVEGVELLDAIRTGDGGKATEVLVVAPALNSRLRHWVSDEDRARREAALRLGAYLQELGRHGIEANGWVGDADPLLSITDTLHRFPVDEIVIATDSERGSNWLARNVVGRARRLFPQPIRQVVVEGAAGRDPAAPNFKTGVRHLVLSSRKRAEFGTFGSLALGQRLEPLAVEERCVHREVVDPLGLR